MRRYWSLLKETYEEWDLHKAPKLGAGLAYYTILSLAPLLIVIISVIGFALGKKAAEGRILEQIQGLVGSQGAEAIQTVIANANKPATGTLATIIGLLTLFLGASGVFGELHDALNTIWDVPARQSAGFAGLIRQRFLSFGMVLAIGFLLLVSLVLSAGIAAAGTFVGGLLPVPEFVLQIVNLVVSVVVITALFALIYRFLPDEHPEWRDVIVGAAVTSVLFSVGKLLIGLYLGKASVGSPYGAAGSLVVVLVWIYYSAQIFLFGAEFTHVYARHRRPEAFRTREAPVVTVPAPIDPSQVG
jgi:membrane protein